MDEERASHPMHSPAEEEQTADRFEARLAEETRRAFASGREMGQEDERKARAASQAAAREEQKLKMAALAESFARERKAYLHTVEDEVVRLALAIAARILRREAQTDPLLLTGAVRAALGQLSASTAVRLRVPQAELDLWTEALAHPPHLPANPEILPDSALHPGDCRIESTLGTAELGIRAQLSEIERGFFDHAGASVESAASSIERRAADAERNS
jgi:flagellar assembly protein FliH